MWIILFNSKEYWRLVPDVTELDAFGGMQILAEILTRRPPQLFPLLCHTPQARLRSMSILLSQRKITGTYSPC
jgi:hypothetical protein